MLHFLTAIYFVLPIAPPPKEEKKEPKVANELPSFSQPLEKDLEAIDGAPLSLAVRVEGMSVE